MIQNRLLETAVREFGRKGLDGASTRGIAKAAGTAMSSITYHYGGKEALHLAAGHYIVCPMDHVSHPKEGDGLPKIADAPRRAMPKVIAGFINTLLRPCPQAWGSAAGDSYEQQPLTHNLTHLS